MEAEVLRPGADTGDRMVAKFTCADGLVVHAIGLPQAWPSSLGPTWSYVLEADKLTLVDTGGPGSIGELEAGLEWLGYPLSAVERVILTHGHMDHDGNCLTVVQKSGAQLWAHEVYGSLLRADRWEREMEWRRDISGFEAFENTEVVGRIKEHHHRSQHLSVDVTVTDGFTADGLTFYHTPGHSPDELCIQFDQFMFSGDHVLSMGMPGMHGQAHNNLAIDRADEQVAYLYNTTHPAVLRLIQVTVEAALRARIAVSVCGEMAGDPRYTALLLGLGVRELSMAAPSLPRVKQRILGLDLAEAIKRARLLALLPFTPDHIRATGWHG